MIKVGRYTAALLLIGVGGAVIADKLTGSQWTAHLAEWWPVLFIMLGVEYIYYNMRLGESERRLRLDIGGLIFAVVISMIVVASTQSGDFFKRFEGFKGVNDIGDVVSMFEGMTEGKRFEQGVTAIDLPAETEIVKLGNTNGHILIRPGNVKQMEIEVTVYVNLDNEADARSVAEASKLTYSSNGGTLDIRSEPKEYGTGFWSKRKPRMDLTVTVPSDRLLSMDVRNTNGKIDAAQLPLKHSFTAETTNGEIVAAELKGELRLHTTNGQIKASNTKGTIALETTNGRVELNGHEGDAKLDSTNGEISVAGHSGPLEAETTNGAIAAGGLLSKVRAETTNGSVTIASEKVNGDWEVETTHGKIELRLPKDGDYQINGEGGMGSINTDLPLQIDKKVIHGTVGSGAHEIKVDTNGSLSILSIN